MSKTPLPIDSLLPEIVELVANNPVTLLQAEPGAGKTTRVPPALLAHGLDDVYVLEPRRLATRMAARRVAEELGEPLGRTVGYQVRFEEVSGPQTRLWYVTEGVLTRKLLSDNGLRNTKVVVLDEFHERHVETDLALALLRKYQASRGDLRLLIMSATLASNELVSKLGSVPMVNAPGRVFPVSVRYTPPSSAPLEAEAAAAVSKVLTETNEHVLLFLPGAAEIRKVITACEPVARQFGAKVLPLHGELSPAEQDEAVAQCAQRKIICSTNVAESSVTIDGVEAVVDSGLARVMTHSPWSGISRLHIERISKSSAIQRAGRAGRTGPGIAIRLYSESDFVRRPDQTAPEITRADLSQLILQLAASGFRWEDLTWLDTPGSEILEHSHALLVQLGALDSTGAVSPVGRLIAKLPIHPRLARFVLSAAEFGAAEEACELAARLSEGRVRLDDSARNRYSSDIEAILAIEPSYAVRRLSKQLRDAMRSMTSQRSAEHAIEKALLTAYRDRVARRRNSTLLLSGGGAAKLDANSAAMGEFLVALEIDDRSGGTMPLIRLASHIEPDWLLDFFPNEVQPYEEMTWNREAERVEQVNSLRYGQLVIDESRGAPADRAAAARLLVEKALEAGVEPFSDAEELGRFLRRVQFAAEHNSTIHLPDDLISGSLLELAAGVSSFAALRDAAKSGGLLAVMESKLPMRLINETAPTHVQLPSGRRARIEYHEGRPPSVASRLQDFFGMKQTPTVAGGTVPLVVHLLAPNHRPVQMTTDLVSFWKNLYPQVRRELSRRYPRHAWPEVPA
jgi:ATP-dependent helicase HrpB